MDLDKFIYFIPRLTQRFLGLRKHLWKYVNVNHIAMGGYSDFKGAVNFKGRLRELLGIYNQELAGHIGENDGETILCSAEQTLNHDFNLLGSGVVRLDPIDWHVDFKTGKHWPKEYYSKLHTPKGADIKVPWELSRCQHLLWLGEAYLMTSNGKYAQEVIDEIHWWIDDNPLMYSVNWKCAMDVAFRAVNWMFALNMISEYEGFDDTFTNDVSKSLWQHAFFIRNNLERQIPYSNNHYLSDIVGLLYLGTLFDNTSRGRNWRRFALKEFYSEIRKQVLPSGVHYERSVSYHRMMTEMLSYPVFMLQRTCEIIPDDVIEVLVKMYAYVSTYTKPNGLSPLIADNDDGRFVPFIIRDFRYHNYLNDPKSVENIFVTTGFQPYFCSKSKTEGSHLFADAGIAVVRSASDYLFINNGGYSKHPKETQIIIGTHTHNDLLSFDYSLSGKDLIVDPGTFLYTSSKTYRDAFRATAKHNTVVVDDEEQNDMVAPFYLQRNVCIQGLIQLGNDYEGMYQTIKGQLTHRRRFQLTRGGLLISDHLTKHGSNHHAKLYFHFAHSINPTIKNHSIVLDNNGTIISFSINPEKIEILDDTVSPSFGVILPSKTLLVNFHFNEEISIQTSITSINSLP